MGFEGLSAAHCWSVDAGLPTPSWSFTCDIALVNSTLNGRRPSLPVFPPGPRKDAEEEAAKLATRGPRIPVAKTPRNRPKDVCRVWLSGGEADLALISLPPAGRFPEPTAGVAFYDRDVHGLLSGGKDVGVDIFGYSPATFGKAALRVGEMRLLQVGVKDHPAFAMPKGYAHFDPLPGVAAPQFVAGGDSGGPSLLRGASGGRPVQVGVTSYNLEGPKTAANPTGDQPPSFVVQPFAATEAMLLEWMGNALHLSVAPPTSLSQPLTSQTFLTDWNGDGLTDIVTIDTKQTSVRLASATGYLSPTVYGYGYVAAFDVDIDVARAIPVRLGASGGKGPALLSVLDGGTLAIYSEYIDGSDRYLFGLGQGKLPFGIGANRTADNTFVVHVSDPSKDELLLVDPFRTTLVRQDSPGHFDVRPEALVIATFGAEDPAGLDFRLADVDGDGRTDFIHRTKSGVGVSLGQPSGAWGQEQVTPYGSDLPDTAGVRFVDLNKDGRDDLVWLERQSGPGDARYIHVRLANSDKPNAKPQGKPGTFGPEQVSPIEIGDGWTAKGAGSEPLGVGGYDVGDLTGDGVPDVANVGTFGTLANGIPTRVPALFVKPGKGDGTFGELQVLRLALSTLSVKGEIAEGFALLPTRKPGRADPVFTESAVNGYVDVLVTK